MTSIEQLIQERQERMIDDSEPAFPSEGYRHFRGLSMRDWFAGMALQGLMTNAYTIDDGIAETAYKTADAMMKARGE